MKDHLQKAPPPVICHRAVLTLNVPVKLFDMTSDDAVTLAEVFRSSKNAIPIMS